MKIKVIQGTPFGVARRGMVVYVCEWQTKLGFQAKLPNARVARTVVDRFTALVTEPLSHGTPLSELFERAIREVRSARSDAGLSS